MISQLVDSNAIWPSGANVVWTRKVNLQSYKNYKLNNQNKLTVLVLTTGWGNIKGKTVIWAKRHIGTYRHWLHWVSKPSQILNLPQPVKQEVITKKLDYAGAHNQRQNRNVITVVPEQIRQYLAHVIIWFQY